MDKVNYVLVNLEILPDVYSKVLEAKNYLASGEAQSASQAVRMAGISRSAYYKYKDAIFEYNADTIDETVTINAKLADNAGVLSAFMNEIYKAGANVLSVNQSVPVNSVADVSATVRITEMVVTTNKLVETINNIRGVNSAYLS